MGERYDIHNIQGRLRTRKKWFEETNTITNQNKKLIRQFCDQHCADGMSNARLLKYYLWLPKISQMLGKNLDQVKKEDVVTLINTVRELDISDATKNDYKIILKRYYKWLWGKNDQRFLQRIDWLRTGKMFVKDIKPKLLLTQKEVDEMILQSTQPIEKAFFSVLYEGGMRIEELLTVSKENVEFDKYGAKMYIQYGKTGPRPLRLVSSVPYLSEWIKYHPHQGKEDAPLWLRTSNRYYGKRLNYATTRVMMKRVIKRTDIIKPTNPHYFRHSRATHLANYLSLIKMCLYFGWTFDSRMPRVYIHLAGKDVDEAILKIHGLKKTDRAPQEEITMHMETCPRCQTQNNSTAAYCIKCGMLLDINQSIQMSLDMIQGTPATVPAVPNPQTTTAAIMNNNTEDLDSLIEKLVEAKLQAKLQKLLGQNTNPIAQTQQQENPAAAEA